MLCYSEAIQRADYHPFIHINDGHKQTDDSVLCDSVSLVEALMEGRQERWRTALLRAGGRGRAGRDCGAIYYCHAL